MTNALSLYVIEDGLAELLLQREEAYNDLQHLLSLENTTMSISEGFEQNLAEARQALAIIEKTLVEYFTLEARKVDNYHRFITTADGIAKQIKAEEATLARRRRRLEAAQEFLKDRAAAAMKVVGKERIDGTNGRYLLLKGNGGRKPVVVDGWDEYAQRWTRPAALPERPAALPEQFLDVNITVPGHVWRQIRETYRDVDINYRPYPVPSKERIRAVLESDCQLCKGSGAVADTNYPIPAGGVAKLIPCLVCDAGKQRVPGARLAERGAHIEVK